MGSLCVLPQKNGGGRAANGNTTAQIRSFGNEAGVNGEEMREQLRRMAREVMYGISEIDTSRSKELIGVFVSELFLLAVELERREFRRQKQAEGIAAAKERGIQFGRGRIELPEHCPNLARLWQEGGISSRRTAEKLGISHQTFRCRAKEYCAALAQPQ